LWKSNHLSHLKESSGVLPGSALRFSCRWLADIVARLILEAGIAEHFHFACQPSQRVCEAKMLDEQIVLEVQVGGTHGGFQVKGQPLLNT
jgi:hypothetical protein